MISGLSWANKLLAGPKAHADPPPPHHHGKRFRNPAGPAGRGLMQQLKWAVSRRRKPWPKQLANPPWEPPPRHLSPGTIAATFINQSTFLLQVDGLNLLTDPVYSERVGPWNLGGPRRVRPPGVPLEALPPIHCVLLSHNHYDHLDLPTLKRLSRLWAPLIVTGLRNSALLSRHGLQRVIELDWWQTHWVSPSLQVTYVPAQHFSCRSLHDRDRALWGGFLAEASRCRIYFAGDTGYAAHFKEIGRRFGPIDLALMPIGAYQPRWFMHKAHMNPDEAVRAHLDVRARLSLAMHFGTFRITDEGIDDPIHALDLARRAHGVAPEQFRVPEFGQTILVPASG
jgi:L-ascorbate metabolism protein UlaG (beta-lactamase superfamily)